MPSKHERRRHPRINQELPFNVLANGYDLTTTTKNLSCLGAYCHLEKYIPPFTKISIRMALPVLSRDKKERAKVECGGVIVRTEDAVSGGFNVAIFFNNIKESQKQKISRYIQQILSVQSGVQA